MSCVMNDGFCAEVSHFALCHFLYWRIEMPMTCVTVTQWPEIWQYIAASFHTGATWLVSELKQPLPVSQKLHWRFLNIYGFTSHIPHISHYQASMKWPLTPHICQSNLRSWSEESILLRLRAISKENISLSLKHQCVIVDMISHPWEGLAQILTVYFQKLEDILCLYTSPENEVTLLSVLMLLKCSDMIRVILGKLLCCTLISRANLLERASNLSSKHLSFTNGNYEKTVSV